MVSLKLLEPNPPPWRAALQASARTHAALAATLRLTPDEDRALDALQAQGGLPLTVTPHWLARMDPDNADCPLRRQVIPHVAELTNDDAALADPLGEEALETVPFLVHRYPDRVLFLVTDRCGAYCRFCTRKRLVGQGPTPRSSDWQAALDYIRTHDAIREVILSGGDALMLPDDRLADLLSALRAIEHVDIIRIATRMPSFVPERVTSSLVDVLRAHQPVYVLTHINHPKELSPEVKAALAQLVDGGVPVLVQTVLLAGINDDEETLTTLFRALTRCRVRPYYLHQCDLAPGTKHFRVPLARALMLMQRLRGRVSGLSVPTFVVDIPGGHGKVPVAIDPVIKQTPAHVWLRGFDGGVAPYPLDGIPYPVPTSL